MKRFYSIQPNTKATWNGSKLNLNNPFYSAWVNYENATFSFQDAMIKAFSGSKLDTLKHQRDLENIAKFPVILIRPLPSFRALQPNQKKHSEKKFNWSSNHVSSAAYDDEIAQEIRSTCRIPFTPWYDPLICFRELQMHSLSKMKQNGIFPDMGKVLQALFKESPERYFRAIKLILTQSHYVTQNAVRCLEPASWHLPTKEIVEDFAKSERGHDKLLQDSLDKIPYTPTASASNEVIYLLSLLKYTAENHILAFAFMIDFFERESSGDNGPVVQSLLQYAPEFRIQEGIQKHARINEHLEHDAIGFNIASKIPKVNKETIDAAIQACEYAVDLLTSMVLFIHREI